MRYVPEPPFRHNQPNRIAVVLVSLGTPDAPTAQAVRRYLQRFLSDPRVVEIPTLVWGAILHGIVLRVRPARSARKYAQIWLPEGSPLWEYTRRQAVLLEGWLGKAGHSLKVYPAMRYAMPDVEAALTQARSDGCEKVLILPLYPQYAAATTASVFDAVARFGLKRRNLPELRFIRQFHDDPAYIDALAQRIELHWRQSGRADCLLMSFHGLPRRSLYLGDPYHCQCLKTGRLLAERLGLDATQWRLSFQSRFGRATWLQPYTTQVLRSLPSEGFHTVDVVCPGFISDCLETLEEIAIEGKSDFLEAGGREFRYIPALNDSDVGIAALGNVALRHLMGWPTRYDEQLPTAELAKRRERALLVGAER